jgi:hypothetical protein
MTAIGFLIAFFSWLALKFVARISDDVDIADVVKLALLLAYLLGIVVFAIGVFKWMWEALP